MGKGSENNNNKKNTTRVRGARGGGKAQIQQRRRHSQGWGGRESLNLATTTPLNGGRYKR